MQVIKKVRQLGNWFAAPSDARSVCGRFFFGVTPARSSQDIAAKLDLHKALIHEFRQHRRL
jgi:hypothetical protein